MSPAAVISKIRYQYFMQMLRRIPLRRTFPVAAAMTLIIGCCIERTAYVGVEEIRIRDGAVYASDLILRPGEMRQLMAEIVPGDATVRDISWRSDNDGSIATITAAGLLTAVSEGYTTITVMGGNGQVTTVSVTVASLNISYCQADGITSLTLLENEAVDLTVSTLPSDIATGAATWTSSNTAVATVSSTGDGSMAKITALTTGTTTITATGVVTSSFELTVAAAGTPPSIIVRTEPDLRLIQCRLDAYYTLANDITLTKEWLPVGDVTTTFSGTLDGAGFSVKNLFINKPNDSNLGLVGVNSGAIKNVGVEVGRDGITGRLIIGSLVGDNRGSVSAIVTGSGMVRGSRGYVGGLVGYNNGGTVTGYVSVDVNSDSSYVGGLVGLNGGGSSITGYATGKVSGLDYVGGLVGRSYYGAVIGYYSGTVQGMSNVGGLSGGHRANLSGGSGISTLIGYSRGSLSVTTSTNIGRVIGSLDRTATANAYYSGKTGECVVTGGTPNSIGMIITINATTLPNSFAGFTFGTNEGEWTFHAGRWPSINLPADSIFDRVRGDNQPINP